MKGHKYNLLMYSWDDDVTKYTGGFLVDVLPKIIMKWKTDRKMRKSFFVKIKNEMITAQYTHILHSFIHFGN